MAADVGRVTVAGKPGDDLAPGATVEQAEKSIREAIEFHLDGMREDGIPIPPPSSQVEYVEAAA